ncbi:serine/threonine-protein kinase SRPK, partial [Haematococcus lacustris]
MPDWFNTSPSNPFSGPRATIPVGAHKRKGVKLGRRKADTMPKSKARNDSDDYDSDAPLSQSSDSEDEGIEDYKKGGYHPVNIGETYHAGKYTVLRKLGWGHFSTVWLVINNVDGGYGAMKVQKSAKHYTEAACDEITLLTQIKEGDPSNSKHCVHLLDHFQHTGPNGRHVCMVFE